MIVSLIYISAWLYPQKHFPRKFSVICRWETAHGFWWILQKNLPWSGAKVVFLYKDEVLEIPAEILLLAGHAPLRK